MDAAVIVVGAGPAGLMLAGELRLAGVDVILLERLAEPTGESRGLGFTARTMEVLDQRGLLDRIEPFETSNEGHFGGIPVNFGLLPGAQFGGKSIPQARTERMLAEWVTDLGVDFRRGWELVGLSDHGDRVEIEITAGGDRHRLSSRYLVGCDGGRSTVRKLTGFDFPGTAATLEMYLADVRGCSLRPRMIGEHLPGGMVMAGPLGDGVDRIIVCERGTPPQQRTAPPSFEEVAAGWQRLTGEDISGGTPVWVSAFGDATRQVTEYQRGNVILAGDAAHIHLPAGGQGMNTGIQDAVNLGWKLAAVVNGTVPADLLQTYHTERHAVGQRLLLNTRAQGLLFLSGPEMQPLRDVLAELIRYPEVSRHLAAMVSGLEIRYDVGSGEHALLGARLTKVDVVTEAGKTNTAELLRTARGVLVDCTNDAELRAVAKGWADRVDVVTGALHGLEPGDPLATVTSLLVRPDGHLAWLAPGAGELRPALERWFGVGDAG